MDIKLHKNDLPDDLDLGNLIAVDGEFMGLNIRRDPLCLIQISSGNSDAHIIQLDRMNYKAPNLINVLQNDKITKIFHYGRADLAFIKYYLKTDVNNVDCTKIQSKIARTFSDNHSLKSLIKEFINDFEILSVLRNLKIIGIFMRLALRDNKKKYAKMIPYAWEMINYRMRKNREFNSLKLILKHNFPKFVK